MPITDKEVLQVLRDPRLRVIRFSVGPIQVNSVEYNKVSDYIESGAIDVVPGKENWSKYNNQTHTLTTRAGDPPLDLNARTGMLHEGTHIITAINKYPVTRMTDEAAAYLAQFAFLLLLNPSQEKPPIGRPKNDMMRQGMDLVEKYHLCEAEGYGAIIDQRDIISLAQAVHRNPDYQGIKEEEKLQVDGVDLSDEQSQEFYRLQVQRFISQSADLSLDSKRNHSGSRRKCEVSHTRIMSHRIARFSPNLIYAGVETTSIRRPRSRGCSTSF